MKSKYNFTINILPLLGLLFVFSIPATVTAQNSSESVKLESIVKVPIFKIDGRGFNDISSVGWKQIIEINGQKQSLDSEETLSILNISSEIKEVIRKYREERDYVNPLDFLFGESLKSKEKLAQGLQFSIEKILVDSGYFPKNYFWLKYNNFIEYPEITVSSLEEISLEASRATGVDPVVELISVRTFEKSINQKIFSGVKNIFKSVKQNIISFLTVPAFADATSVADSAINYILDQQNEDGSWGENEATRFITTVAVIEGLQSSGYIGEARDKGIDWLQHYFPINNDYRAEKLKILAHEDSEDDNSQEAFLLANTIDETGGFTYNNEYESDPFTTAKVIQALFAADFEDSDEEPYITQSVAINYLINTQREDKGWSVFENGISTLVTKAEVVEALLLWKHQHLGDIEIDDTLDPAVDSLITTQSPDGSWNNEILNSALAYHAVKSAGRELTFSNEIIDFFEASQDLNGSFLNNIYTTAKVLKALSVSELVTGQLIIEDIIPLTTLQTGLSAEIKILITNNGNIAVDQGVLHYIVDDYNLAAFDFDTYNIVINPGETKEITIGTTNTRGYVGDVKYKLFVEGTVGTIHPNSRYEETLTFVQDPTLRPGLPIYFVAYKDISNDTPAITWKWYKKSDPNRANYVPMWRKVGDTTWTVSFIGKGKSSFTKSGLQEDVAYEATLGTADSLGNIYYYTSVSQVTTSSIPGKYKDGTVEGVVLSAKGLVKNVNILGATSAADSFSDENGNFLQKKISWGTGYAKVSDFLYESYVTKYVNSDDNLTSVKVYTNLIPDEKKPEVTNVFVVGESDKKMDNKETELIQYTISDDIKSEGNEGVVQSASFYYLEPDDDQWYLIGTEEGLLMNTRTYAWHIPGTLQGKGYKIKVILRDFSGKDSKPETWGKFQLTKGNESPALTFISPTLTGSSTADQSYMLQWVDEDDEDNALITFYYDLDSDSNNGNHTLITSTQEDSPEDTYVWNTSSILEGSYYIRAELSDGVNFPTVSYSGMLTINH